jgi:hypothetical protein
MEVQVETVVRMPLADYALRAAMSYHQVRAKLLRGELRGGKDEYGRFYVEVTEAESPKRRRVKNQVGS